MLYYRKVSDFTNLTINTNIYVRICPKLLDLGKTENTLLFNKVNRSKSARSLVPGTAIS